MDISEAHLAARVCQAISRNNPRSNLRKLGATRSDPIPVNRSRLQEFHQALQQGVQDWASEEIIAGFGRGYLAYFGDPPPVLRSDSASVRDFKTVDSPLGSDRRSLLAMIVLNQALASRVDAELAAMKSSRPMLAFMGTTAFPADFTSPDQLVAAFHFHSGWILNVAFA
jgi:hypothetical protein